MTFSNYYDLCETLEKEVSEIQSKKETYGFLQYKDLCILESLLSCIKDVKEIMLHKEDEAYEKGGY